MNNSPDKLVFIAGAFDGMHEGHKHILREAAALGPLYVAINHDAYLARKGPGRPLFTQIERAKHLFDTGLVSAVLLFEDNPLDLIRRLKPSHIVVGGDYTLDRVVGADECWQWNGQVVIIPRIPGFSTTELLNLKLGGHLDA